MSNGDVIKCSTEHPLLARYINNSGNIVTNIHWMRASEIAKRIDDGNRIILPKYFDVWKFMSTWEAGYLAGAFDGEGSLSLKYGDRYQMQFSQRDNEMLHEFIRISDKFGYKFSRNFGNHNSCYKLYSRGGKSSLMKMVGEIRPVRLMNKILSCEDFGHIQSEYNPEIVDIRAIGDIEVVGLSTTTKTFFSDGYASHNSADGNARALEFGFPGYPVGDNDIDLSYYNGTVEEFRNEYGLVPGVPNQSGYVVLTQGLRIRSEPTVNGVVLGYRAVGEVVAPVDYGGGDFWVKDEKGWSAVQSGGAIHMKKQVS